MIPILYAPSETGVAMATYIQSMVSGTSMGLGFLTDIVKCNVLQERNGAFELEMEYPITGALYGDIQTSSWIKAKAAMVGDAQLFRVYKISKPINGIVTINAEHISYLLNYAMCSPFTASGKCSALMTAIYNNTVDKAQYPFTLTVGSDKVDTATVNYELAEPENVRALLGGKEGSMLDVFGGEYEFDNLTVKLWNHRGQDNGVLIKYGKNLTDIKQEISDEKMLTGVYPYWRQESEDENGNTSTAYVDRATASAAGLSAVIYNQDAVDNFPYYPRVISLDLSNEDKYQNRPPLCDGNTTPSAWTNGLYAVMSRVSLLKDGVIHRYVCMQDVLDDEYVYDDSGNVKDIISHGKGISPDTTEGAAYWDEYNEDEFAQEAQKYFSSHNMADLDVSIDVSFVDLSETEEYKDILPLESVKLCDTVHVEYGDLGVKATLKVISTTYNVLEDRYDQITLGNAKSNFANTVAQVEDFTEEKTRANPTRYNVSDGVNHLMQLISTSYGGYKIDGIDWGDAGTLYFADSRTKSNAKNIVRINQNGIFFSQNGYNGPYETGFGIDGQMVANMLTAWRLNAERLDVGFISADGTKNGNYWDLDTGEFALGVSAEIDVAVYSSSTAYKAGDIVKVVSGSTETKYKCIKACTGVAPPNATYWTTYSGGSTLYDMLMNTSEAAATADGKAVTADGKAVSAQSTANTANTTANSALSAANSANSTLSVLNTFEGVFNKLTKNGTEECIKKDSNDHLYINASWIKTGALDTAFLKVNGISLAGEDITFQVSLGDLPNNTELAYTVIRYPYMTYVWIEITPGADISSSTTLFSGLPKSRTTTGATFIPGERSDTHAVRSLSIFNETSSCRLVNDQKLVKDIDYYFYGSYPSL